MKDSSTSSISLLQLRYIACNKTQKKIFIILIIGVIMKDSSTSSISPLQLRYIACNKTQKIFIVMSQFNK